MIWWLFYREDHTLFFAPVCIYLECITSLTWPPFQLFPHSISFYVFVAQYCIQKDERARTKTCWIFVIFNFRKQNLLFFWFNEIKTFKRFFLVNFEIFNEFLVKYLLFFFISSFSFHVFFFARENSIFLPLMVFPSYNSWLKS